MITRNNTHHIYTVELTGHRDTNLLSTNNEEVINTRWEGFMYSGERAYHQQGWLGSTRHCECPLQKKKYFCRSGFFLFRVNHTYYCLTTLSICYLSPSPPSFLSQPNRLRQLAIHLEPSSALGFLSVKGEIFPPAAKCFVMLGLCKLKSLLYVKSALT